MISKKVINAWQHKLGLDDWKILVKQNCNPDNMYMPDVAGCTSWTECHKEACVQLIAPQYYPKDCMTPYNEEKTFVHELLHLKFALLWNSDNSLQDRVIHQIIDDLAKALCNE